MSTRFIKGSLLATTVIAGMAIATPAFAQATPQPRADQATSPSVKPATDATTTAEKTDGETIVVTGSIIRRTSTETPSPVTIITVESLDRRGISTIQDGIQKLAANNGPALTNSFTANGAFAGGASSVSLRALSTNSTLVLFDGQRSAYYPLADDGARNFVDLNTIPDDIVERIEVLRDGASSSYGADAIAGVVNIITKRTFNGLQARAEAGISQHGVFPTKRGSITIGTGDLKEKGFNAYISGFYYHQGMTKATDLPSRYATSDQQGICYQGTCGSQGIFNGTDAATGILPEDSYTANGLGFTFRKRNPLSPTSGGTGKYTNASCGNLPTYNITQDDIDGSSIGSRLFVGQKVCQTDFQNLFGVVDPKITRWGVSGRVTAMLGDTSEVYAEANFLNSKTFYTGFGSRLNRRAPAPVDFPAFSLSSNSSIFAPGSSPLALPVYVCANGVGSASGINTGCNAGNGTLNPDNPFAAQGFQALVSGGFPQIVPTNSSNERAYRLAVGIKGDAFGGWNYAVDGTLNHIDLDLTATGYARISNLLSAIARGQISFSNPLSNTQQQLDAIMPVSKIHATSDLYSLQGTIGKSLFDLPGGPLQLGLGAQVRYEGVNDPSGNPDANGPTERFLVLNAFGAVGHRTVYSAFAEIDAPFTKWLDVNVSGRYDKYSSGPRNFSPKIGFKFTPVRQLALRGTYSRGFRIPSFGEANSFPTTGYVTASKGLYNDNYLSQYGCSIATYAGSCPSYLTGAAVGLTTLKNPNLTPEKSRSITLGAIFEPVRNVSFTVDFYNIKKKRAISNPNFSDAENAYYGCASQAAFDAGSCNVAGFNVVQDSADTSHPNALPRIAFIEAAYVNANTIEAEGLDFGASIQHRFGGVKWSSSLDASYIIKLNTTFSDGSVQRYAGTLGNFNLTAGSGTPRWHGDWENTLDFGHFAITGTANYFGGYNLSAEDQTGSGTAGDCSLSSGIQACNVKSYITVDAVGQFKVNDRFSLYLSALNVFNRLPPLDTVTYGAYLYNPVQGSQGIYGRYFKAGVKANF